MTVTDWSDAVDELSPQLIDWALRARPALNEFERQFLQSLAGRTGITLSPKQLDIWRRIARKAGRYHRAARPRSS